MCAAHRKADIIVIRGCNPRGFYNIIESGRNPPTIGAGCFALPWPTFPFPCKVKKQKETLACWLLKRDGRRSVGVAFLSGACVSAGQGYDRCYSVGWLATRLYFACLVRLSGGGEGSEWWPTYLGCALDGTSGDHTRCAVQVGWLFRRDSPIDAVV